MSPHHNDNLKHLSELLLSSCKKIRTGSSHDDVNAEFYTLLGMVLAACTLDAINLATTCRLHELALNASERRADELTAINRNVRVAATQEAAA